MTPADPPSDERQRLCELRSLGLLDTPADPAFDQVTRLAQRIFQTEIALVSLIDDDRQWFKSRIGLDAEETSRDVAFCAHAIHGDEVMVVEDARLDPRFEDNPLVIGDPSIRFYAGAPLRGPNGHRLGTLCVIDSQPRSPTQEDLHTLKDLAALVEREITQAAVAVTDSLTGLYNRRGFVTATRHMLALAERTGDPLVLLYADLDGLKLVNDRGGHEMGDNAICATAMLLADGMRHADVVARIGGDEFAILLYGVDESTIEVPLGRLSDAISRYNTRSGSQWPISLSVGFACWSPGESFQSLMARADGAMYDAKRRAGAA